MSFAFQIGDSTERIELLLHLVKTICEKALEYSFKVHRLTIMTNGTFESYVYDLVNIS